MVCYWQFLPSTVLDLAVQLDPLRKAGVGSIRILSFKHSQGHSLMPGTTSKWTLYKGDDLYG